MRVVPLLLLASGVAAQSNAAVRRELPATATAAGAVALDGSPGIYYVAQGAETRKFVIYQKGGGWCYSDTGCAARALTELGSSNVTFFPQRVDYETFTESDKFKLILANRTFNPLCWNWTRIFLPYLDGGSQTGDLDAPVSVGSQTIFYRGARIHRETVAALLAHEGLGDATDVIISGGSAGALATYLHADSWAAAVPHAKVVAVPDSGFFLAYNATKAGGYDAEMRWVFTRMNATGGVPASCIAAHASDPAACIFAESVAPTLRTPIFAQQSTYDAFQISAILQKPDSDVAGINAYGALVKQRVTSDLIVPHADAAVFLDSCLHHVGEWDAITIDGQTVHEALQQFYDSVGKGGKRVWVQGQAYPCRACCTNGQ